MARISAKDWNKKQKKYEEKLLERDVKAAVAESNEKKARGHIAGDMERADTNRTLFRISQTANDIRSSSSKNSAAYKNATRLLKRAVNSENSYRRSMAENMARRETTRPANRNINSINPMSRDSYYNRLTNLGANRQTYQYEQAKKAREDYLAKYGDVDNMSSDELKKRIKNLEDRKSRNQAIRSMDGTSAQSTNTGINPTLPSGLTNEQKRPLQQANRLTSGQRQRLDADDARADDFLEVYQNALPGAILRDEEKKLTAEDKEILNQAAELYRRENKYGAGMRLEQNKEHSTIDPKVEKIKAKGVDTDWLIDTYATRKDNAEQEANNRAYRDFANEGILQGALASAATVLASPMAAVEGAAAGIGHYIKSQSSDKPVAMNQSERWLSNATDETRSAVNENIKNINNPFLKFGADLAYNGLMAAGDSAMSLALGGAAGAGLSAKAATRITQGLMSVGAAQATYNDAVERGLDANHALGTALMAGVAEWATEKYSIDGLKHMVSVRPEKLRNVVTNIGKQMLTEGSEEAASDVLNFMGDNIINGKKSEYNQNVKDYMQAGLSRDAAKRAAMMDFLGQTAYDAAVGAFSGALMGGGAEVTAYKTVKEDISGAGQNIKKAGELNALMNYGKALDIKEAKGKVSEDIEVGRLADAVEKSINEKVKSAQNAKELQTIYEELSENAPDSVGIQIDHAVREKAEELSTSESNTEALNAIYEASTDSYIERSSRFESKIGTEEETTENEEAPVENEVEEITSQITGNKNAVFKASGEPVTIDGFVQTGVKDVEVKIDGETDTVPLSELTFESPFVERMYHTAAELDDAAAASAMISNYDGKQNAARYFEDFEKAYNFGSVGLDYNTMTKRSPFIIPENVVRLAYDLGVNAWVRESEKTQTPVARKGTGKAIDTREDLIRDDGYSEIDKALAKRLGIDIKEVEVATDSEGNANSSINGYLDLSKGEMVFSDACESKLGVRIHETMEFIEAVTPQDYRRMVMTLMYYMTDESNLSSVYDTVMKYRDAYREEEGSKTFAEAMDEFMNDAISGVFMSEEGAKDFINWLNKDEVLENKDKQNVLQTIANVIQSIINKIKDTLDHLTKAQQTTANMEIETQEHIKQMFLDAMDKAGEVYKSGETVKSDTKIAASRGNSLKVLSDGTKYVKLDGNLFDDGKGGELTPKEAYKKLIDTVVVVEDGDEISFVNKLPGKKYMYDELFKRRPNYDDIEDIKGLNKEINSNIIELFENSKALSKGAKDIGGRHKENNITRFDTREIRFVDDLGAYRLELTVAELSNGKKVAYAKRYVESDNELKEKIKATTTGPSRQKPPSNNSISRSEENATPKKKKSVKIDTEGRKLTPEQQEFFKDSKIKDEQGRLIRVYHGTPYGGFTEFKNDLNYYTANKEYADRYHEPSASSVRGRYDEATNRMTYEGYLNITHPFDVSDPETRKVFIDEYVKGGWSFSIDPSLSDSEIEKRIADGIDWTEADNIKDFIDENDLDYDGIILNEGADGGYGEEVSYRGLSYVTFASNQFKNIDNETPTKNPDIRYSLRRSVEGAADTVDLIKENEHLKEAVRTLEEEFENTDGTMPDEKKIKTAAGRILKQYSSTYDKDTLVQNITAVYRYLMSEGADYEEALKTMSDIAKGVLEKTEIKDTSRADEYKDLRKQLHSEGIALSEAQRDEIKYTYGSMAAYRKACGYIKIKPEGATTLDQQWQEWSEAYPELFSPDVKEGDMPMILEGIISSLAPQIETLNGETIDQMSYDVALQIYHELAKVPVRETFADKKDRETYETVVRVANSYEKLLEAYRQDTIEQNKAETAEELEKIADEKRRRIGRLMSEVNDFKEAKKNARNPKTLEQYKKEIEKREKQIKRLKEANDMKLAEQRQRFTAQRLRRAEQSRMTETKDRIRKLHQKFRTMINKPTETMYVPAELMRSAIEVCETVNLGAKPGSQLYKALDDARRAFEDIKKDTENYGVDDFNPQIQDDLDRLALIMRDKGDDFNIYDMTAAELQEVYDCMNEVYESIRRSVKLIREEGEKDVRRAGRRVIKELNESKGVKDKWISKKADKLTSSFLNSYREFRRLSGYKEDAELMDVWKDLNAGQRKMYDIQMEGEQLLQTVTAREDMQKTLELLDDKKGLVKVPLRYESGNADVYITRGMRLALILHGRSQANFNHMAHGGVMVPVAMDKYKKDKKEAYEHTRKVEGITKAALMQMESELTKEEKDLLKIMEKFFHDWTGDYVNQTSMDLYGFKKARVHEYYPISVDKDFVAADIASLKFDKTIEGAGFLKERISSVKPIVLESVIDTAMRSLNAVSMFSGLAIPIRNFNKIMNVTTYKAADPDSEGTGNVRFVPDTSVRKTLKEVWGERAEKYLNDLIADLQQARNRETTWYDKLRSNYAGAVLTANMSVIIKQTSAYPTCAGVTGWVPTIKAMFRGGKNNWLLSKADVELINQYTPLHWYRNKGNGTRELAEIRDTDSFVNRFKPVRFAIDAIQKVDMAMVGRFWYAAQYSVNESHPELKKAFDKDPDNQKAKDAYYNEVAKIFDRCVEETQSTNMTLQNADIMRNPADGMKIITMFMGQGLQNFGIVYDSFNNMRAKKEQLKNGEIEKDVYKQAKKDFANAVTSQIVSAAVFSGLAIVARALLHRMNPYRDDKEEITAESIIERWSDDFLENMAGSVPLGSFIYEGITASIDAAQGKGWSRVYGQDDIVLGAISDLESSTTNLVRAITKGEGILDALNEVAKDGSKLCGVPYENVWNLCEGTVKHIKDTTNGEGILSFSSDKKNPSTTVLAGYLDKAIQEGDSVAQEKYIELLYDLGKSSKEINSLLAKQLKERDDVKEAAVAKKKGNMEAYEKGLKKLEGIGYPEQAIISAIKGLNRTSAKSAEPVKPSDTSIESLKEDVKIYESKDLIKAVEDGDQSSINLVSSRIYKDKYEATTGTAEEKAKAGTAAVKNAVNSYFRKLYMSSTTAHERQDIKKKLSMIAVAGKKVYDQSAFQRWEKDYQKK